MERLEHQEIRDPTDLQENVDLLDIWDQEEKMEK